jgi:hypothetical protein
MFIIVNNLCGNYNIWSSANTNYVSTLTSKQIKYVFVWYYDTKYFLKYLLKFFIIFHNHHHIKNIKKLKNTYLIFFKVNTLSKQIQS